METVVLIHGLFMPGAIMALVGRRLRASGFATRTFAYPSRRHSPAQNALALESFVASIDAPVLHFVAHSLGGLVLRHFFAQPGAERPGRVVTLGTPHCGCRVARSLARRAPGRWLLGRSMEDGLLGDMPPWPARRELGVIAGTLPVGLGRFVADLPLPNDGVVALDETKLDGATDHSCLRVSHLAMVFMPDVATLTVHFLRHGRFGALNS